jgi:hypothetical protein
MKFLRLTFGQNEVPTKPGQAQTTLIAQIVDSVFVRSYPGQLMEETFPDFRRDSANPELPKSSAPGRGITQAE